MARPALTFSLLLVAPVAVEAVKQFGPPALGQTAERLRMSDGAIGEDPPGVLSTLPALSRRHRERGHLACKRWNLIL
jgi:hypothetical protein